MNKKLEGAKEILKRKVINYNINKEMGIADKMTKEGIEEAKAIETVLNYIENSIPKEKVEEKIEELRKEFYKLDEETDKYLKEDNKDLTKYYEQRERTVVMQTIGWAIGKMKNYWRKNRKDRQLSRSRQLL